MNEERCCGYSYMIRSLVIEDEPVLGDTFRILTETSDNLAAENNDILRKE